MDINRKLKKNMKKLFIEKLFNFSTLDLANIYRIVSAALVNFHN